MDEMRAALFDQFREEVDSHLLRLSQGIVALERDPGNADLLKEVFRSAHTIKGSAKMMGYADIARVTHEMESVLGAMRDHQVHLDGDISDLLIQGVTVIDAFTRLAAQPGQPQAEATLAEIQPDHLIAALRAVMAPAVAPHAGVNGGAANGVAPAPAPIDPGVATTAGSNGHGGHHENGGGGGLAVEWPATAPFTPEAAGGAQPDGGNRADLSDLTALKLGDDSIRVKVSKLDALMNLSGEMLISKMQYQTIDERMHRLLEMERNRTRHLGSLVERVERAWGSINQADMEAALAELRGVETEIDDMTARTLREFQEYTTRLNGMADELESTVLGVRLLPIQTLFGGFPLAVRNFMRETGKEVDLHLRGGETEIDKQILEALGEPLVHLLRNALDHGIEPPRAREAAGKSPRGTVTVRASRQGTQVLLEVADDGAGMDPEQIRRVAVQKGIISPVEAAKLGDDEALVLVYYPGFSTAPMITDVSGRGVGMDVVKTTVERLHGTVAIQSLPGAGTTVALRLPLTLTTLKGLLIRVGTQIFVLPSHSIEGGMDYVSFEDIFQMEGHEVARVKGRVMPLIRLDELLDLARVEDGSWLRDAGFGHLTLAGPATIEDTVDLTLRNALEEEFSPLFQGPALGNGIHLANKLPGIIVGTGERLMCFLVDELIDELDVVVKSLGPLLGRVNVATGATVLGDGRVVVILDVQHLLAEARNRGNRGQLGRAWRTTAPARKPRILVVDDSITTRELEKSILENAGYQVEIAMDGLEALRKLEAANGRAFFDLVIADIEMPRMDGLQLTERIKAHVKEAVRDLPVIIVSSLASDAYKQRGIELGAQAYITKGQFDQSRLLETIDLLIH